MQKVIRNGMVAVLYSKGYGAGWYSWNTDYQQLLFHPKLVELVEADRQSEINEELICGILNIDVEQIPYLGGAETLVIQWLKEGTRFEIEEYDGAESIKTIEDLTLIA